MENKKHVKRTNLKPEKSSEPKEMETTDATILATDRKNGRITKHNCAKNRNNTKFILIIPGSVRKLGKAQ